MRIEIVGADLPLTEVTRVVLRMAEELGWKAHWDGEKFQVRGQLPRLEGRGLRETESRVDQGKR